MIKLIQEIQTHGPISELSKKNHTLFGYDNVQNILQVDLKNAIIFENKLTYPPISVKCLPQEGKYKYFIINMNSIEIFQEENVSVSNSKSEFCGDLDLDGNSFLYTKYHHNFKKYSLSYLLEDEKKILSLSDTKIESCFFNKYTHNIIYESDSKVATFNIENPEQEIILSKKSSILHDSQHIYLLDVDNKTNSSQFRHVIYDFRSGKQMDSWKSKDLAQKIEGYGKNLIVASKNNIDFYDIRKLIKPFHRQSCKGFKDFLFEPNINKFYVGTQSKLNIYKIQL